MRFAIWGLLALAIVAGRTQADSPAMPEPYVTSNGAALFKMIPAQWDSDVSMYVPLKEAYGEAYLLQADGSFKELWRVEGWYAFGTYISRSGEVLVRMGPWPTGDRPASDDLAVAFYQNGVEVKSYATTDLIKNPNSVSRSVSHYQWRAYEAGFPRLEYNNRFYLKTVENIVYVFDANTGLMLEERLPENN